MSISSSPCTKVCRICGQKKHVSNFMPAARIIIGQHMCKNCNVLLQKENIQEQEVSGMDQKRG